MKNLKQNQNVTTVGVALQGNQTLQRQDPKQNKGITLIALVITIIVLLILAGVTIGALTGEQGILTNAKKAGDEHGEAKGREQIELALGEDTIIRSTDKTRPKLTEERLHDIVFNPEKEKWVKLVEIIEDENIEGVTIINDEGYIYDVIINANGEIEIEFIGNNTELLITRIKITDKQLTEITIEAETLNAEGGTYKYSYKKQGESYTEPVESNTNTYTFKNLEISEIYTLKVEVENKNGKVEKETPPILMGELPEGTITFIELGWENAKASIQINTIEEDYTLQYQINGKEEGVWTEIENGATVTELEHNTTVYARLWNDEIRKGTQTASITITDEEGPEITGISVTNLQSTGYTITVEAEDGQTGIKEYRYYIDGKLRKTSTENTYEETELVAGPTHKAYVIVVDKVGNETKTEEQEIKHEHTEECYSTECTGEFETISTSEETWLTCEHVHDGDTKFGGLCYTTFSTRECGGRLFVTNGQPIGSPVQSCANCSGGNLLYWSWYETKCSSCGLAVKNSNPAADWACSRCGFVFSYAGICNATVRVYSIDCNNDGVTQEFSRTIEEIECTTCGVRGTHKEAVETFTCEMCRQEHSAEEETVQHNQIAEHKVCPYD